MIAPARRSRAVDPIYEAIEAAVRATGLYALRADKLAAPGLITDQILDAIRRAGLVIADVSNSNPNVLYEVGIAHTLDKTTLILTNSISQVPFDIRDYRMIVYDSSGGMEPLREALINILSAYTKELGNPPQD